MLHKKTYIVGIATPSREHFHRQQMLGRCRRYPKTRMIEYSGRSRVASRRDVDTCLLVEPPPWHPQFVGNNSGFLKDHTVRLKNRIDIARRSPRVVRKSHRGTTENVQVSHDTPPRQSVAETTERILDHAPIEQRIIHTHATSNSCAATNTPRRRNAAGAFTTASVRAALLLKGNQNCRNARVSVHAGAPRPSRAARCSAKAARKTSQCSLPILAGSASSNRERETAASHRYSSRNSAIKRQRVDSSAPASKPLRRAKLSGSYRAPTDFISTTVVHRADEIPPRRRCRSPPAGHAGSPAGAGD